MLCSSKGVKKSGSHKHGLQKAGQQQLLCMLSEDQRETEGSSVSRCEEAEIQMWAVNLRKKVLSVSKNTT